MTHCLINELGIDNSLSNPTYTPTTLTKEDIRTIIGLCYIPLDFQPKKKNWIYRHFTGFIHYTSVLTNRLYCWVCQTVHETSSQIINIQYIFYQWSKYYDTRYTRSGVNQMCILKNSKELLEYIQSRSLSSCNSIKTFDYSNLYTTIPHSKRMLVQLCFIKKE